jgi:hypothetical protein
MKTMQKIADEENQTNLFIKRLADCVWVIKIVLQMVLQKVMLPKTKLMNK